MLIQNISTAATPKPASDSAPAVVAAPQSEAAAPAPAPVMAATPAKPAAEPKEAQLTDAQLQSIVDNINKAMKQSNSNVEFAIDKATNKTIIKVVEAKTGDVIRQYPSEEILAIARAIDRMQQQGLLIAQKA